MSQFDKLINRIKLLDKDMRFEELRKVLERFGYTMDGPGSGSSHKTFRKPGEYPITIPMHDPIKRTYIELIRDMIEREENKDENV